MKQDDNGNARGLAPALRWIHGHEAWILRVVVSIAFVLTALFCLLPAHRLVSYLSDDAYYYLKVARHIAEGKGPTFDGITLTTGFHPLYTFILAAFNYLFSLSGSESLVRVALLLNAFCFLATGWLILVTARQLWGTSAGRWGAILWYSNPNAYILAATGMEASLYSFCLASFFAFLAFSRASSDHWSSTYRGYALLGLLGGACVVARTDALVLVVIAAISFTCSAIMAWHKGEGTHLDRLPLLSKEVGKVALFASVALLPFLAWLLYAHYYTGTFFQASAQMKQMWRHGATAGMTAWQEVGFGLEILWKWTVKTVVKVPAFKYLFLFIPAIVTALVVKKPKKAAGDLVLLGLFPLMLGLAYCLTFPKTWTWYYAPGIVTLSLLSAGCLSVAFQSRAQITRGQRVITRWLPLLLVVVAIESYGYLGSKIARGRNRKQQDMYTTAVWMRDNLPPETRVAAWNAGLYGWYSGLAVINLDGLINNEIADVILHSQSLTSYLPRHHVQYVVDEASYMAREIPEWAAIKVHHLHQSQYMEPIAIWDISEASK